MPKDVILVVWLCVCTARTGKHGWGGRRDPGKTGSPVSVLSAYTRRWETKSRAPRWCGEGRCNVDGSLEFLCPAPGERVRSGTQAGRCPRWGAPSPGTRPRGHWSEGHGRGRPTLLLLVTGFRVEPTAGRAREPHIPELGRRGGSRSPCAPPGGEGLAAGVAPAARALPASGRGRAPEGTARGEGCGRSPGFRGLFSSPQDSLRRGNSRSILPSLPQPPAAGRTVIRGNGNGGDNPGRFSPAPDQFSFAVIAVWGLWKEAEDNWCAFLKSPPRSASRDAVVRTQSAPPSLSFRSPRVPTSLGFGDPLSAPFS